MKVTLYNQEMSPTYCHSRYVYQKLIHIIAYISAYMRAHYKYETKSRENNYRTEYISIWVIQLVLTKQNQNQKKNPISKQTTCCLK